MTILVLLVFGIGGLLVMPAHCRQSSQLFQGESMKSTPTPANSTSILESKIQVVFCFKNLCAWDKGSLSVCYCCVKPQECYHSATECQAHCPSCNPKCQVQSSADPVMETHSSNLKTMGTLF
ncbi:hypothetical protein HU200_028843 [Digitaria exilis]|uniref:TNFR-Cys domain-containing protein n=1 Tax=Digitaria exilis TaxID=1010633 RepID=A0A835EQ72_9POAL|nr:hypothetical protein HU200_028843 [Digitaria exilis]